MRPSPGADPPAVHPPLSPRLLPDVAPGPQDLPRVQAGRDRGGDAGAQLIGGPPSALWPPGWCLAIAALNGVRSAASTHGLWGLGEACPMHHTYLVDWKPSSGTPSARIPTPHPARLPLAMLLTPFRLMHAADGSLCDHGRPPSIPTSPLPNPKITKPHHILLWPHSHLVTAPPHVGGWVACFSFRVTVATNVKMAKTIFWGHWPL